MSKATLRNILYPLWDAGFQVGHAAVTAKEAIERCANDVHAVTSLLTARLVSGPNEIFEELVDRRERLIKKERRALVRRIAESIDERHRSAERAGWTLAPDIKNDIGGLRDANSSGWLNAVTVKEPLPQELEDAADVLLAVREGLHAESPRKLDQIRLDLQAKVAARLGLEGENGADVLMEAVHTAARTIEHTSQLLRDHYVDSALGGPKRSGSIQRLGDNIVIDEGRVRSQRPIEDLDGALSVLSAVADTGKPPVASVIAVLKMIFGTSQPGQWTQQTLEYFVRILKGPYVEQALELIDHTGGWMVLLPEWLQVRSRAQHDPYHRYTVDGHSFRAVAHIRTFVESEPLAAAALDEAGDSRALYVGTLLHDIGKGTGEDHSVAGARAARIASQRMGLPEAEVSDVEKLVRHHLLLSDTATRRDIDDGAVVTMVADTVGDARVLRFLYILSGADGLATGHGSWTEWKASLVAQLYRGALLALESGEIPQRSDVGTRLKELQAYDPLIASSAEQILNTLPPSYLSSTSIEDVADDVRLLMHPPAPGAIATRIDPGTEAGQSVITICFTDRPGTLARTAGVLTLHRISVLSAQAYSTSTGIALERFIVDSPEVDWSAVETDLAAAYSGRLALEARLERKAMDYKPKDPITVDVRVLQDESDHSTVVEVRAGDALGLLYALCSAISELELDIHVAKIDTLGERVVDVFYLRSLEGGKIDSIQGTELVTAIQHRVDRLFG